MLVQQQGAAVARSRDEQHVGHPGKCARWAAQGTTAARWLAVADRKQRAAQQPATPPCTMCSACISARQPRGSAQLPLQTGGSAAALARSPYRRAASWDGPAGAGAWRRPGPWAQRPRSAPRPAVGEQGRTGGQTKSAVGRGRASRPIAGDSSDLRTFSTPLLAMLSAVALLGQWDLKMGAAQRVGDGRIDPAGDQARLQAHWPLP